VLICCICFQKCCYIKLFSEKGQKVVIWDEDQKQIIGNNKIKRLIVIR